MYVFVLNKNNITSYYTVVSVPKLEVLDQCI